MNASPKPYHKAWLWWMSALTLALGIAIYILLKPVEYDPEIERLRMLALFVGVIVAGLSIIIGTSKRWFGKGL